MCVWLVLPWGEDPECRCLLSWAWCWDCGFPKCHPEADLLHDLLSKMFLPGPISVPLPQFAALSSVLTGCWAGAGKQAGL